MANEDFGGIKLCVVGDKGAGKSHFLATLYMHLLRFSRSDESLGKVSAVDHFGGGVGVEDNVDRLQRGLPTIPMETGETSATTMTIPVYPSGVSGFLQKLGIGGPKNVDIHILDSSGEYQSFLMTRADFSVEATDTVNIVFGPDVDRDLEARLASQPDLDREKVNDQFRELLGDYDAYVLLYNLEDYKRADVSRQESVDLKLMRFLDNVKQYRARTNKRPPKHVAMVFTHYDVVEPELETLNIPKIKTSDSINYGRLLAPQTYNTIEVLTDDDFDPPDFVSFTNMVPDKSKFITEIDRKYGSFVTKYPSDTYDEIVEWIKGIG